VKKSSNFNLQIDRVAGGFRAKAFGIPDLGEATNQFDSPFEDQSWGEDLLERSGHLLREIGTDREDFRKTAETIGRLLFKAVFAGEILSHWNTSRLHAHGGRLRLRLRTQDPELASWPWELLFDPNDSSPLVVTRDTPVVRYLEMQGRSRPLWTLPPLRILVVTAAPEGCIPLAFREEWEDLQRALAALKARADVELDLVEGCSLAKLHLCLQKPVHILHFIGHGVFDEHLGEGQLLFENDHGGPDRVSGRELATAVRDRRELRLVVLNACEGARGGEAAFTGVAGSLVRAGAPAVIAMRSVVTDQAAILFAQHFYEGVAKELPVDIALADARKAMYAKYRDGVEWATPVLFMRSPNGRLFRFLTWRRTLKLAIALLLLVGSFAMFSSAPPPTRQTAVSHTPVPLATIPNVPLTASIEGCPASELLGMTFVRIPAGTFTMGLRRSKNNRAHQVKITRPFCMSIHEVTQGQWEAVMKSKPSSHQGDGRLPVENVSHEDVQTFLERFNQIEPRAGYQLPTEAQWEYGARAESSGRYSFGNDPDMLPEYGNCKENDGFDGTARVGSFKTNKWGLHDMYGNVSEWVADWYAPYPSGSADDPKGPPSGEKRVRRGGSWELSPERCTSAERTESAPSYHSRDVGFRLVRDVVAPPQLNRSLGLGVSIPCSREKRRRSEWQSWASILS
jgi:formylglycine-generating enzyme required for sulfatase activity